MGAAPDYDFPTVLNHLDVDPDAEAEFPGQAHSDAVAASEGLGLHNLHGAYIRVYPNQINPASGLDGSA